MAFVRQYSEAGDVRVRTMRAGQLLRRVRVPLHELRAGTRTSLARMRRQRGGLQAHRLYAEAGDPFRFRFPKLRLPKVVRKLSLKKVVRGVGRIAKAVLPIAAPFLPGIGPLVAPLLGESFAGGGSPDAPAPELVQDPTPTGPPGRVYRQGQIMVPGVEVEARAAAPVARQYYEPEDEDEDELEDQDEGESLDYYEPEEE